MKYATLIITLIGLIALCVNVSGQDVIELDDVVLRANNHYNVQTLKGEAAEFICGDLKMRMGADSSVVSLVKSPNGQELLDRQQESPGFYMTDGPGGQRIRFGVLYQLADDLFMVTTINPWNEGKLGAQKIVFSVTAGENYLVFRIKELIGIPKTANYQIFFDLKGSPDLRVVSLDYMTIYNKDRLLPITWPAPWIRGQDHKGEKIPLGAFALYHRTDPTEEDEILAQIWANEDLPHPKVDYRWNVSGVKRWMEQWLKEFSDRSAFWYSHPKSPDELERLLPHLQKMGIKELHIYHWTWQNQQGHCRVAKNDFFPNGREDLIKLADRLSKIGIKLSLHYNFCEIPFDDPLRIGTEPSHHLAVWGTGKLAKPIDATAETIYFKPDRGVELPNTEGHHQLPPAIVHGWHFNFLRIDNEIIRFENAFNTDSDTWILTGCTRGLGSTNVATHEADTPIEGLISSFGVFFIPDTYGPLFDEMVKEQTDLWNEAHLRNIEYDGCNPDYWAGAEGTQYRRWLGEAYRQFDHPTWFATGHRIQRWGHFEYWFNDSRRTEPVRLGFRGDMGVRPRTTSVSRVAATVDEAHVRMSQVAAVNGNEFGMSLPLHYPSDWEKYGRFEELVDVVVNWKEVSGRLSDSQRKQIHDTLNPPLTRGYYSEIVWWLRKEGDKTKIYPQKNPLTRRAGDVMWGCNGGEVGWVTPEQYIKCGETLELENPFAEQPPMFTIRVMPRFDYNDNENIPLFDDAKSIHNSTEIKIEPVTQGFKLCYENPGNNDIDARGGSLLANWSCRLDLTKHRGIGMWVTGDGSGAILIIRIGPHRDYAVRVDFTGRRYIEIPNAEVSWADTCWGGPDKSPAGAFDYKPNQMQIGFGYVPARANIAIQVEGIKALKEYESIMEQPEIAIDGQHKLTVKGAVATSQWLDYRGGSTAGLYDKDWNKLDELPVVQGDYKVAQGWHRFTISAKNSPANTWIATRFITEGEPIEVNFQQ